MDAFFVGYEVFFGLFRGRGGHGAGGDGWEGGRGSECPAGEDEGSREHHLGMVPFN